MVWAFSNFVENLRITISTIARHKDTIDKKPDGDIVMIKSVL